MKLEQRVTPEEQWERRFVSALLDLAHQYCDLGKFDLAEHFVGEAKQYANSRYKEHVEAMELHLEIGKVFDVYDKEQEQAYADVA